MRTPKRLKIAETRSRLIAVDWESLGYNITRCHTFNVTICYHYMTANNRSKADCLDMDPKGDPNSQFGFWQIQYLHCTGCANFSGESLFYLFTHFYFIAALSATSLGWEPATLYQRQPQDDPDQPRRAKGER